LQKLIFKCVSVNIPFRNLPVE